MFLLRIFKAVLSVDTVNRGFLLITWKAVSFYAKSVCGGREGGVTFLSQPLIATRLCELDFI